jgi:hypothetical protein
MTINRSRAILPALLFVGGCGEVTPRHQCREACAKVYETCGSAVRVNGVSLPRAQCELVCEEGLGMPQGAAPAWLDCVEESVCPGQPASAEQRDRRQYDVDWCNPQFQILTHAG